MRCVKLAPLDPRHLLGRFQVVEGLQGGLLEDLAEQWGRINYRKTTADCKPSGGAKFRFISWFGV